MLDLFRKFLFVGGLSDAVNAYLETKNIQAVRDIQDIIHDYYATDASKYDDEMKLKIHRIYDLISSNMENKKELLYKTLRAGGGRHSIIMQMNSITL